MVGKVLNPFHQHHHQGAMCSKTHPYGSGGTGKRQKHITRSSNGCYTCKRRKKKCDGCMPVCSACKRLKLNCAYPENLTKWEINNLNQKGEISQSILEFNLTSNNTYIINSEKKIHTAVVKPSDLGANDLQIKTSSQPAVETCSTGLTPNTSSLIDGNNNENDEHHSSHHHERFSRETSSQAEQTCFDSSKTCNSPKQKGMFEENSDSGFTESDSPLDSLAFKLRRIGSNSPSQANLLLINDLSAKSSLLYRNREGSPKGFAGISLELSPRLSPLLSPPAFHSYTLSSPLLLASSQNQPLDIEQAQDTHLDLHISRSPSPEVSRTTLSDDTLAGTPDSEPGSCIELMGVDSESENQQIQLEINGESLNDCYSRLLFRGKWISAEFHDSKLSELIIPETAEILLSYFCEKISPRISVCNRKLNSLVCNYIPLACDNSIVLSALLAWTALHLEDKIDVEFKNLKRKLFDYVVQQLPRILDLNNSELKPEFRLATLLILISMNIKASGNNEWLQYLRMAQDLTKQLNSKGYTSVSSVYVWLQRNIAYHEITGASLLLSGPMPTDEELGMVFSTLDPPEGYMGICRSVYKIFAQISYLSKEGAQNSWSIEQVLSVRRQGKLLEREICSLPCEARRAGSSGEEKFAMKVSLSVLEGSILKPNRVNRE